MNNFKDIIIYYLLMFPAILIGTIAMVSYGVAASIWIQNIFIWIVGTVAGSVYLIRGKESNLNKINLPVSIVFIALLAFPFWFNGLDGVHRWLTLGPIQVYIASIILPFIMIHLWKLALNNREGYVAGLITLIACILFLHPDANQLTAFICASAVIMWKTVRSWMIKALSFTLTVALVILSWVFLDDLAPVPYVEQILFLVSDLGHVWFVLGVLSLILLVLPFFLSGSTISISLGVYFLMTIIGTFIGNFPMPIMGYGISPIVGYFIAITWYIKNKEASISGFPK
ncbi:hypothetical protein [Sporosarcina ureilytica]|uniref:Cell division protein n=1 Tax=Sporosarcina ureilytica TaxID=298596 RepID=A0A1D8JF84_9BACL|nr:hypothetical protein [Sporosarcina ureilytica]AOV07353.1 hypothetical protein BI350_07245 [Sporosarcina ureilytica]